MINVWKIGMSYVDPKLMLENNLAYAYGDSMVTYLENRGIGNVKINDLIILATSVQKGITKIGIVKSEPFYCNNFDIKAENFIKAGISPSIDDTIVNLFKNKNQTDVVYFLTSWLEIDPNKVAVNFMNTYGFTSVKDKENLIKYVMNETIMKNYLDLLENNKNIILTGAPGTGKTFLAKEMALKMIFGKAKLELLSEIEKKQFTIQYGFVQFHPSYDYTDFVEGFRPDKKNDQKEIEFVLRDGIFMSFCKEAMKEENKDKKFVFVIDEINRGEISKIFGELFFSIDPGYRGDDGKVKTQYANLREGKDQYFYVPKNVYVIGTMNDIDRSVESFDFAMRRRFAWIEVTAKDSQNMFDLEGIWKDRKDEKIKMVEVEKIKNRMDNLNKAINDRFDFSQTNYKNFKFGLSQAYQIGASYFLKLGLYTNSNGSIDNNSYINLWNNHLYGVLFEYLRGTLEPITKLAALKFAFENDEETPN
jgi:5-methylcytosine-specific restriction endonuclease McrBC GTP-binding regulatory subunit McrB